MTSPKRNRARRASPGRDDRAERNIEWIQTFCRIPEGKFVGKPVVLRSWQQDILRQIYDTPTRRAIISFGRKNAKTTLSAFLLLLHLCGPEARPNSQLYSAAQSREQAAILFSLAAKTVRLSPDLNGVVTIRDTAKQLACQELGTLYRALSAEASTAYGLSPAFIVHDELGQVKGPRSELYEALETACAATDDPLSIVISTQAPTEADLLSVLIDDAEKGSDPRVKLALFTSDVTADPFDVETIRQANPAFGDFQSADEVLAMAEDARRMPSRESEYRNLILNQRVDRNNPFIAKTIWQANGGEISDWGEAPVYAGLDLSSTADLTAFVPVAWIDDAWEVDPTFWLPGIGLEAKSRADRAPYDLWASQGLIETPDAKSIEYEFVAQWLYDFCQTRNVRKIAFDRWGMKYLRPWLVKAGFTEERIDELFAEFGQGFQSMSPALRDLEAALLNEKVRHGNHPVLTMCAANAVVTADPAGGRKLNKAKAAGRIDGMVALTMAFGIAPLDAPEEDSIYEGRGLLVI
jgi:phage terminase large subunit-like protein